VIPAIVECKDKPVCETTNVLGDRKTWFVKKLGMWKEHDATRKESVDTEEIIFAEEQDSLNENCFTASKPFNDEYQNLECDISSTNSIDETIEFETILASTHDNGSDYSSECVETFDAYINDRCGKVNPVQDILKNVRTHHWKDFFKTSYLSQNECCYERNNFDFSTEQSCSMTNVELNTSGSEGSEGERTFGEISTQEAFGSIDLEMNEEYEKGSNERNWMRNEKLQSHGIPKKIRVTIVPNERIGENVHRMEHYRKMKPWCEKKSAIMNLQEGEAFIVKRRSGSKVAKNMQSFFHQVTEVDEANLQQRKYVYAAKTRDRDPFTEHKKQTHDSDALHQVQLKWQGQEQPGGSTSLLMKISNDVLNKRNGQPSSKQEAVITNNSINKHHNKSNEIRRQATLDTTVMVEMSKTERAVGHNPRSQSVSGGIPHQSLVIDNRNGHDNKHTALAGKT